ncbi:MAG: hypothetical protein AAB947_01465 [Patescibacteria group bacterium]
MLHLYIGTDRENARAKMRMDVLKVKGAEIVRITDAHTIDDLKTALQGGGMFGAERVLVFESVCGNPDMCEIFLESLKWLSKSDEDAFIYEEKPLIDVRKRLEKYAGSVEKFDAPKKERDQGIFKMADALRAGDKKALWVSYMRELQKESAPEAVHGILFWGAKDAFLKSSGAVRKRAGRLVVELAELPHEARRNGFDLEYALEHYLLAINKS